MTRLWRRWKCSGTTLSALPWCNKSPSSVKSTTPTRSAFFWGTHRPASSTFCKLSPLGSYQNACMADLAATLPPKISKQKRYVAPIEGMHLQLRVQFSPLRIKTWNCQIRLAIASCADHRFKFQNPSSNAEVVGDSSEESEADDTVGPPKSC